MSFDPAWILLDLVLGGIGLVLLTYGRKQQRLPHLLAGLLFIVYPFFIASTAWSLVVGVLLGAALWWSVKAGW